MNGIDQSGRMVSVDKSRPKRKEPVYFKGPAPLGHRLRLVEIMLADHVSIDEIALTLRISRRTLERDIRIVRRLQKRKDAKD